MANQKSDEVWRIMLCTVIEVNTTQCLVNLSSILCMLEGAIWMETGILKITIEYNVSPASVISATIDGHVINWITTRSNRKLNQSQLSICEPMD